MSDDFKRQYIEKLENEIKELKKELIPCKARHTVWDHEYNDSTGKMEIEYKCDFCKGTGWVKKSDILAILNKEKEEKVNGII